MLTGDSNDDWNQWDALLIFSHNSCTEVPTCRLIHVLIYYWQPWYQLGRLTDKTIVCSFHVSYRCYLRVLFGQISQNYPRQGNVRHGVQVFGVWCYADGCAIRFIFEIYGVIILSNSKNNWVKQQINSNLEFGIVWCPFSHINFICYFVEICC